jgi:hypothetical protein
MSRAGRRGTVGQHSCGRNIAQAEVVNHTGKAAESVPMGKELEEKLASRFSIWFSMGGDPLRTAMECSLGSSSKTLRPLFEKSTKHPTELFLYAPSLPLDRHHPLRTGKHKATRQKFFPTTPS